MVGKTIGKTIDEGQIPVYVERFGHKKDEIFVTALYARLAGIEPRISHLQRPVAEHRASTPR